MLEPKNKIKSNDLPGGTTRDTKKFGIQQSKVWQDSVGGMQKLWSNYLHVLSTYFHRMPRNEQEELISKFSLIISIGGTALAWCQIYPLFHPTIRVIAFPATIVLAYWFGKNIVYRIMLDRFKKFLNDQ